MILLTGATGFIGSHLLNHLVREGHKIRVLLRDRSKWEEIRRNKSVQAVAGDITDLSSLHHIMDDIEIVFHLASIINAEAENYEVYWKNNVLGTFNLIKLLKNHDLKRFVYCSSVGVMGRLSEIPANEDTPCNPENFYEKSKFEAENLVRYFSENTGMPVSIIRPSWVYGPNDKRTLKLFQAIKKKRFFIIGDGKTLIHPVYVTDMVQGLTRSAFHQNAANQTFIIGGSRAIPLQNLTQTIAGFLNRHIPRVHCPLSVARMVAISFEKIYKAMRKIPPIHQRRLEFFIKDQSFDIAKARCFIGYQPKIDINQGILTTVQWYQQKKQL